MIYKENFSLLRDALFELQFQEKLLILYASTESIRKDKDLYRDVIKWLEKVDQLLGETKQAVRKKNRLTEGEVKAIELKVKEIVDALTPTEKTCSRS